MGGERWDVMEWRSSARQLMGRVSQNPLPALRGRPLPEGEVKMRFAPRTNRCDPAGIFPCSSLFCESAESAIFLPYESAAVPACMKLAGAEAERSPGEP